MAHMDPALKKQWVDALRSGDYLQAQETLKGRVYVDGQITDDVGYCCLGVLCDLRGAEFNVTRIVEMDTGKVVANTWDELPEDEGQGSLVLDDRAGVVVDGYLTDEEAFTTPLLKRYGIPKGIQKTLIKKNDNGVGFGKIADHIERYL